MKKILCWVAGLLTVLGAVNWGLVGLFNVNLVEVLFGTMPQVVKIVYILIGLSGLVFAALAFQEHKRD